MKFSVFFILLVFASQDNKDITADPGQNNVDDPILVKIEEEEYDKVNVSKYFGVTHMKRDSKWRAERWSKAEKRNVYNGVYKDEETAALASDNLARKLMANSEHYNVKGLILNFPDDNIEVYPEEKTPISTYFGVNYNVQKRRWIAVRSSKKKRFTNGSYKDAEKAARASDTLARQLIANGEHHKGLNLNFPNDNTEVHRKKVIEKTKYIGLYYNEKTKIWRAQRRSKKEEKNFYNGYYKDEEIAAHASDTLARKLMANGDENLMLNFPNDDTEVFPEEKKLSSMYVGVTYKEYDKKWFAQRWSKKESEIIRGGGYKDEETAARVSDTLARKLMAKGEQDHKLNFPDDKAEMHPKKKISTSKYSGVHYNETEKKWRVERWDKNKKKNIFNGSYKDEETAAHASDTLAKKLMVNGDQKLKLNFPNRKTELRKNKRKRSDDNGGLNQMRTSSQTSMN